MRVVAIADPNHREYILDMFSQKIESDIKFESLLIVNPKEMISSTLLQDLNSIEHDTVLIAIRHNHYLSKLLSLLHDGKEDNIYVVRLFALDAKIDIVTEIGFNMTHIDKVQKDTDKPYLVHLETHICDHCNLNCKACNNFSPFVRERQVADVVQFEKDMQLLSQLFFNIGRFFLLGGEPLLEPGTSCKMIKISRKYFPNSELRLLTNGTLISKMTSDFWRCIREHRVIIHISVYPPLFEKLDEIEKILQENGITYLLARKVEKFVKRLTLYPFEDQKFNNIKCDSAGCHYLRDGVLSKCPDGILIGKMAQQLGYNAEALMDQSVIKLNEDNDAWEIIHQLDNPCNLCKRCTHHRLECIPWEPVGTGPNPGDWLLENRLEYENRQLQTQVSQIKLKLQDTDQKLRDTKERLRNTDHELQDIRHRFQETSLRLQNIEKKFNNIRDEYNATRSSFSFRLGRALTWMPRKLRQIKDFTPFKILRYFKCDIMNGFRHYTQIMEKYGPDAQIYKTSGGTGDVYVAGMYFKEYLRIHNIKRKPIFTVIRNGGNAVAELFEIENIEMISYKDRCSIVHLGVFLGFHNIHFTVIHHNPASLYTAIAAKMETVHNMCSLDVLKNTIYDGITPTGVPTFDDDREYLNKFFRENNLCIGKTVVLAPYSVSMKPISKYFWERLAEKLVEQGFSVCTNSQGVEEPAIKGTIAINIPIKRLVPFLNLAGALVSVRSGIVDVSSTANIKRVILYSDIKTSPRGQGGHNRKFYPHFSFNKWFERDDAFEIEYSEEQTNHNLRDILSYLQN